jgi:cytochrome b
VVKIWDLPVRLFHWSVVILVGAAWWTAQHDEMSLHRICGYLVGGLVLFRIAWGLVGSSTARFSSFLRGPRTLLSYARTLFGPKTSDFVPGHNPMGGWSVVALLAVLLTDVGVGLFCVDVDGEESGPLADRITFWPWASTLW